MTAPHARLLTPAEEPAWSAFVSRHAEATFYHTLRWRDFIVDVFGHEPQFLVAGSGDGLTGVMPLFRVTMPLMGSKLLSLPYDVGSGGALTTDARDERALAEYAVEHAREHGVNYLELRSGGRRPALDGLPFRTQEPVLISDMVLDNRPAVQSRIASDHRKAVRKASTRGVRIRAADSLADYLSFYDVYLRVFRDFGTPPYPHAYFTALWTRLHPDGSVRLFLAEVDGRCVGGLQLFCSGRSLVSKFAACLPDAVALRTYAALYSHAIEFGLEHGYTRLSWGTSSRDQSGLIAFKERWGATTRPAVLYDLDVRGRAPDIASYYDSDGLHRRLWRRLPLAITRAGGGLLNRWFC